MTSARCGGAGSPRSTASATSAWALRTSTWSVVKPDTEVNGMRASASRPAMSARKPISSQGSGPGNVIRCQPRSTAAGAGSVSSIASGSTTVVSARLGHRSEERPVRDRRPPAGRVAGHCEQRRVERRPQVGALPVSGHGTSLAALGPRAAAPARPPRVTPPHRE